MPRKATPVGVFCVEASMVIGVQMMLMEVAASGRFQSGRAHARAAARRDRVTPTKLGYRSIAGQFRLSTMERIMKTIQSLLVSAALAIGMAAPASAGVNDPEVIIYRFPGVV